MTGRDRTTEFVAAINSRREKPQWIQQRRVLNGNSEASRNSRNKLAIDQQYREFMKISQECSHKIGYSCEKLQQLTQLARQRTVFDDGQLNRLISEIRADIKESKNQLDYLQSRYQPKQKHSENIVTTLQQRLANVTNDFKSALEIRSRSVQEQSERLERYTRPSKPQKTSTNRPIPSTSTARDIYNTPSSSSSSNGANVLLDLTNNEPPTHEYNQMNRGPVQYQMQIQQQQTLLLDDQIDLSERADKMHLIESTIVELGTVFNQLAQMVQTQGETITRIDMNISETTDNVEAAHDALLRYFATINSNRWLMLKVFGILFFFFVLFVIFAV